MKLTRTTTLSYLLIGIFISISFSCSSTGSGSSSGSDADSSSTDSANATDSADTIEQPEKRPNIVLIMTDDQGWGDFGFQNNHHVKTPTIDKLAEESVRLTNFYVSPVCAPTRSSLMTGRHSLRTGVRDTYNGGASMATGEVTIAEILKESGYSTAMFGKWHLGDNYPMRPQDQGFDKALMHLAGGVGQPGDYLNFFEGDSSYFNPTLMDNGVPVETKGYCSDVYTDAAISYIKEQKTSRNGEDKGKSPFFVYLAFNAPHTPLQLPQEYYDIYKDIDPTEGFSKEKTPKMSEADKESARKVYGMVTNIDDNIARVMKTLKEEGVYDNTIVIFLTDNGPQQYRYLGGMRGHKGNVYNGGVKVPCLIHYPAKIKKSREISQPTTHLDLLPTITDLAGATLPTDREIDGISLAKNILSESIPAIKERSLLFYWHRRSIAKYHNIAIQKGDYKLVGNCGYDAGIESFELYNTTESYREDKNLISTETSIAAELKVELDNWYNEMIVEPNLVNKPRAIIGTEHEPITILNRNDAFGEEAIWTQKDVFGYWDVTFASAGYYDIKSTYLEPIPKGGDMKIQIGAVHYKQKHNIENSNVVEMKHIYIPEVSGEFMPWYFSGGWGKFESIFPLMVEIKRSPKQ